MPYWVVLFRFTQKGLETIKDFDLRDRARGAKNNPSAPDPMGLHLCGQGGSDHHQMGRR